MTVYRLVIWIKLWLSEQNDLLDLGQAFGISSVSVRIAVILSKNNCQTTRHLDKYPWSLSWMFLFPRPGKVSKRQTYKDDVRTVSLSVHLLPQPDCDLTVSQIKN